ncbi:hypothetical protein GN277_05775 [Lachnospiraceae bacterium WCA-9-b2]|uniref:Uncharacterized protein n=1 Tax=Sporofaciens musculi TaxID=2681861 RepID=A0A7X3MEH0_9FIRM|nr:hypothetical protein [Sporofaciens musculi]MXP74903.1 hypothetical protein [Sporofaciens musculi]
MNEANPKIKKNMFGKEGRVLSEGNKAESDCRCPCFGMDRKEYHVWKE